MKAWEPEEIFEKADFPVKKPGSKADSKSDAKPKNPARSNSPGTGRPGRPASQAPAPGAGVPRPPSAGTGASPPGQASGAAWEPELDFERADFSGVSPEEAAARGDSRSSSDAMANVAAGRAASPANPASPQARAWQPPKLSEQARSKSGQAGSRTGKTPAMDASAQTPNIVGSRIRQGPGAAANSQPNPLANKGASQAAPKTSSDRNAGRVVNPGGAAADANAAGASGFSQRLLEELTILHRENARHVLRHWYWEKAGMAPEGLGHIAPHDRIYMILSGLGPQVLMVLYESMSPTERRQMQEILNRPPNATAQEASRVRTTFMHLLRADI